MKKSDIKKDPIRDLVISFISKVKENRNYYILGFISILIAIPLLFYAFSSPDPSKEDYLKCLFAAELNNSDYCKSVNVKESLKQAEDSFSSSKDLSSLEGIFTFVFNINSLETNSLKLLELKDVDISAIKDPLIESKVYELYGDILLEHGDFDLSLKKYFKALDLNKGKNDLYSAILKFKVAKSYFDQQKPREASSYIKEAISSDFKNAKILRKMNELKGKIDQELFRKN